MITCATREVTGMQEGGGTHAEKLLEEVISASFIAQRFKYSGEADVRSQMEYRVEALNADSMKAR